MGSCSRNRWRDSSESFPAAYVKGSPYLESPMVPLHSLPSRTYEGKWSEESSKAFHALAVLSLVHPITNLGV